MNAFEFGKFAYENKGFKGLRTVLDRTSGVVEALPIAAGALSYYNPYITAAASIPVIYNGAKWLVDQLS